MLKRKLKMLYLSCHSVEEHDEIKLFHEIGIDVFSHGAYVNPRISGDGMRPPLDWDADPELIELAKKCEKEQLSKELVDKFDAIMVMHVPAWIIYNWGIFKDKIVIWRTTGQSCETDENSLRYCREQGMKIVRYSPYERTIPGYIGEDAIIRFYKDPEEFKDWNGVIPRVINITQNLKNRAQFCGYDVFEEATKPFRREVYGPHNENLGKIFGGLLDYKLLKQVLRDNRCYFYTGTMPACYTLNFIEAFMTGIPIVAIGPERGNPHFLPGQFTYEVHNLIVNGESGFVSDNVEQLQKMIKLLMDRKDVADFISENGRKRAIELFGKEKIKAEWTEFFNSL